MPLSMHRASVPVFARALKVLATLLEKGEAHAKAQGLDPNDLVGARLTEDMLRCRARCSAPRTPPRARWPA
jgi:hypothetical protein